MKEDLYNRNESYNLPLALFTFGQDNSKNLFKFATKANEEEKEKNAINDNESMKSKEKKKNEKVAQPMQLADENKLNSRMRENKHFSTFANSIGSHNSFLSVILHMIYNIYSLRNYILNELSELREKDQKTKMLYHLRNVMIKYSENKKIDISQLRLSLAELFQNRRKFLLEHPDDPCDCYFAIINSLHSFYMQFLPNEITDVSCREKCFAHRNLWLDLARVEECECKGNSKRLYSNFNYIFDIPMEQIFELIKTTVIITNDNISSSQYQGIQVKERHNSQIPYSMNEIYGKLFYYFKVLLHQIRPNCPVKGTRCNLNKTHTKLIINNNPSYLVFALKQKQKSSSFPIYWNIIDILKTFILLPLKFELNQLFYINSKNGYHNNPLFSLFGYVMIKSSKTFTNVCKTNKGWIYYDDDNVVCCKSWYDMISFCLKNGDMPIMVFYQREEEKGILNSNIQEQLSQDEIITLERYTINAENISRIVQNKLRVQEEILSLYHEREKESNEKSENPFIRHSTSNNPNYRNGNSQYQNANGNNVTYQDYMCFNCQRKNRIENKFCNNCGIDNNDIIQEILNIRISEFNKAIINKKQKSQETNEKQSDRMLSERKKDKEKERDIIKNPFKSEQKTHQYTFEEIEQKGRKCKL